MKNYFKKKKTHMTTKLEGGGYRIFSLMRCWYSILGAVALLQGSVHIKHSPVLRCCDLLVSFVQCFFNLSLKWRVVILILLMLVITMLHAYWGWYFVFDSFHDMMTCSDTVMNMLLLGLSSVRL